MLLDSDLGSFEPSRKLQPPHVRKGVPADRPLFDLDGMDRDARRQVLLGQAQQIQDRSAAEFRRAQELAQSRRHAR